MAVTLGDAIVYLRGDNSGLGEAFRQAEGQARSFADTAGGLVQTALKWAAPVLSVAALTTALKSGVEGAIGEEKAMAGLAATVNRMGGNFEAARDKTEKVIGANRLLGQECDSTIGALDLATQITKDYDKSLKLLPLAMDMATSRHIDLSSAMGILAKAQMGNVSMLQRYIPEIKMAAADSKELAKAQGDLDKAEEKATAAHASGQIQLAQLALQLSKAKVGSGEYQIITMKQAEVSRKMALADADVSDARARLSALNKDATSSTDALTMAQKTFGGAASAAADTTAGRLAAMKLQFGELFETVGNFFLPAISAGAKKLTEFATDAIPKVQAAIPQLGAAWKEGVALITGTGGDWSAFNERLASVFGQTVADVITKGAEMASGVVPKLAEIGAWIKDNLPSALTTLSGLWTNTLQPAFETVGGLITPLVDRLGSLLSLFTRFAGGELSFAGLVSGLNGLVPQIVAGVGELATALGGWVAGAIPKVLSDLLSFASQIVSWIASAAPQFAAQLLTWARQFIDWLLPQVPIVISQVGQFVTSIITTIGTYIPPIIAKLLEMATHFVAWVGPQIPILLTKLGELFVSVVNGIGAQIPGIVTKLAELAKAFVAWVGPQIPPLLAELGKLIDNLVTWILSTALPAITTQLGKWAAAIVDWVGPRIPPLLVEVGKLLAALATWMDATALPAIVKALVKWASAFLDWIVLSVLPAIVPELEKVLTAICTWVVTAATAALTATKQIGSDIVAGIRQGVEDKWDAFKERWKTLIESLPEWVKKLLGIASPSSVMRALGVEIPAGLAAGIDAGAGEAIGAMVRLVRDIIDNVRGIATGLATALPATPAGAMGGFLDALRQFAQEAANWMVGPKGQGIMEFVQWFKTVLTPILSDWASSLQPLQSLIQLVRDLTTGLSEKLGETKLSVGDMLDRLGQISAAVVTWAAKNVAGLTAGIPLLANIRGTFESWVASLQPLQSLVQLARDLTGGLADKLGDTKVTVGAMLDRLAGLSHDMAVWEAQNRANLTAGVKLLTQIKPLFEAWLANLQPLLGLLQLSKSLFDLAAVEVSKVKSSVAGFFDNLLTMSEQAVTWVTLNVLRMAGMVGRLQQINPLLLAFKLALDPLAALLPVVKGIVDVGATEVAKLKLSVSTFFGNLLTMCEAVLFYVGDNILYMAGMVGQLEQIKPLLDGLKTQLEPLGALLSVVKGILDLAAVKVVDVKFSVDTFFENLRYFVFDILTYAASTGNGANWPNLGKPILDWFTNLTTQFAPLQAVLSVAKGILDIAAVKVADVKLSVDTMFENLRYFIFDIGVYAASTGYGANWPTFGAETLAWFATLTAQLTPLQPALSAAKGILDIAAVKVADVNLSVGDFFENLRYFIFDVGVYAALTGYGANWPTFGTETLAWFTALTTQLTPLQAVLSVVKGILDIAAGEVKDTKLQVGVFFQAMIDIANDIVAYLASNRAAVQGAIDGLTGQSTMLGNLKTALEPLQPVLSLIQGILKIASEEAKNVNLDVAAFFGHLVTFANAVSAYFSNEVTGKALQDAIDGLVAVGPRMLALAGALAPLNTVLQAVQNTIKEGESVSEGRLEQTFNQRIIPVIQNVRGVLRGLYDKLVSMEMSFFPDLLVRLGGLQATFKQVLDMIAKTLQGEPPEGTAEGKTSLIDAFKAALSKALEDAKGYLDAFYNYLTGDFAVKLAAIDLSSLGYNIGKSLADGLLSALGLVQSAAATLATAAAGGGTSGAAGALQGMGRVGAYAGAGAGAGRVGAAPVRTTELHLHVGTLIADDTGLRKLERTLRTFREQEDARRSGA